MASVAEEFAFQTRGLNDQIQDNPSWAGAWTADETSKLLSTLGTDKWGQKASELLNKDVEACLRHLEVMLMESAHSLEKPAPSKKWSTKLIPRMTERQQLALLLKGESIPEQPEDEHEQWRPMEYDQWAVAKQTLWNSMDSAPDKFYYEHLAPGEVPKVGAWSESEEAQFVRKLKLHPPTGLWGLFSLHIPGRTGQECEEQFSVLHADGRVDPSLARVKLKPFMDIASTPQTPNPTGQMPSGLFRRPPPRSPLDSAHKPAKRKRFSASNTETDPPAAVAPPLPPMPKSPVQSPHSVTKTEAPSPRTALPPRTPALPPRTPALPATVSQLPPRTPTASTSEPRIPAPITVPQRASAPTTATVPQPRTPQPRTPQPPRAPPPRTPQARTPQSRTPAPAPAPQPRTSATTTRKVRSKPAPSTTLPKQENAAPQKKEKPALIAPPVIAKLEPFFEEESDDEPPLIVCKGARPSIPPFSSACLPPLVPFTELSSEYEDETFCLGRVHATQSQRLQEVFARQLARIRRPEEPAPTNFTFLDGCKALSKFSLDRDDYLAGSVFELPWTREQRSRRCIESCHEAQKEADRIHQLQLQTLASLQRSGLTL